jgi:Leu/Phe-tRNA-protein transferase
VYLKYTSGGFLFISPDDDCRAIVDAMLLIDYDEEFCIALDYEPEFVARLMEAGFLVMSAVVEDENNEPLYLILPKLHLMRSALFFDKLHVKKSIRKLLGSFELRADAEFEHIVDRCVEKHGEDWLTPPLVDCIKRIRRGEGASCTFAPTPPLLPTAKAYPASFGLYRDGKLVAGEFGVVCGKVYTSYSGYYDEDNAGTVQMILTARYLQEHGFSFFDFGVPLDYKNDLGAVDICPNEFVKLFRGTSP